jgi:DNA-binding phage protein
MARLRELVELDRDEIIEMGRRFKAETEAEMELQHVLSALKAARHERGMSLEDVKARSGIGKAALSRLENDPGANPTLATISRYASALGKRIAIQLTD